MKLRACKHWHSKTKFTASYGLSGSNGGEKCSFPCKQNIFYIKDFNCIQYSKYSSILKNLISCFWTACITVSVEELLVLLEVNSIHPQTKKAAVAEPAAMFLQSSDIYIYESCIPSLPFAGLGTPFFSVWYVPFFCNERKRTERTLSSFAKNGKERENVPFFFLYIYRNIYRYI